MSEVSHTVDQKAEQMTSPTQILTAKQDKPLKLKNSIPRSQVARFIDGDDELKKNIAGRRTIETIFIDLKTRPRTDYD